MVHICFIFKRTGKIYLSSISNGNNWRTHCPPCSVEDSGGWKKHSKFKNCTVWFIRVVFKFWTNQPNATFTTTSCLEAFQDKSLLHNAVPLPSTVPTTINTVVLQSDETKTNRFMMHTGSMLLHVRVCVIRHTQAVMRKNRWILFLLSVALSRTQNLTH